MNRVENIVANGEIADYLPHCFQKSSAADASASGIVLNDKKFITTENNYLDVAM